MNADKELVQTHFNNTFTLTEFTNNECSGLKKRLNDIPDFNYSMHLQPPEQRRSN